MLKQRRLLLGSRAALQLSSASISDAWQIIATTLSPSCKKNNNSRPEQERKSCHPVFAGQTLATCNMI